MKGQLRLQNLNDGSLLRDGSLLFAALLSCLVFSSLGSGRTLVLVFAALLLGMPLILWCVRCYTLQKDLAELYLPLFWVAALCYSLILPDSGGDAVLSGGSGGQFAARLFFLVPLRLAARFGLPPALSLLAARVCNLLAMGAVNCFAVAVLPYGRNIAAFVTLLPAALGGYACGSAQTSTLSFSLAFLALVLRLAYTKDAYVMSLRYRAALILCSGMMLLCDLSSLPLLLLLLLIPGERFGEGRYARVTRLLLALAAAAAAAVFLFWPGAGYALSAGADPAAQFSELLAHPLRFLSVPLSCAYTLGGELIAQLLALNIRFAEGAFHLPWPVIATFVVCIIYVSYFDSGLSSRRRHLLRCVGAAVLLFLYSATMSRYFIATQPGADIASGLNCNLLLPAAMPAVFFLKRMLKHPAASQKNLSLALVTAALANLVIAMCLVPEVALPLLLQLF